MDRSHKNAASVLKQESSPEREQKPAGERRRLSRYRHDDRGNGYVEWTDAPAELIERPVLEIQDPLELEEAARAGAYDPYSNRSGISRKTGNTTRTDLRKLSEWIKMMRELEERKRTTPDEDE